MQNELVQSRSMQRDGSGAYSIPFPAWAATDRRRDVVAMHYDLPGIQTGLARVRYTPYGVPEPVLVGDLNHDGVLNDDDRGELAITRASGQTTGVVTMGEPAWNPDADLNFDGVIDEDDALALTNLVNAGGVSEPGELWSQASFLRGLTIGYAGMMYDAQAGAFLMRNRWHSPTLGRFISRDPAGYVDGMSLYAYVSGNPLKYWDPFGLAACFFGVPFTETLDGLNMAIFQVTTEMAADTGQYLFGAAARSAKIPGGMGPGNMAQVMAQDAVDAGEARARQLKQGEDPSRMETARSTVGNLTGFNLAVDGLVGALEGIDIYGNETSLLDSLGKFSRGLSGLAATAASVAAPITRGVSGLGGKGGGLTTPSAFFADKSAKGASRALAEKFGPPRSTRPGAETFYNPNSGRSYNVHVDLEHGPPHVDIRTRGPIRDRKVPLKDGG